MLRHYLANAFRSFWRFRVTALVNLAGLTLALVCFIVTYLFLDALLRNGDLEFANAADRMPTPTFMCSRLSAPMW